MKSGVLLPKAFEMGLSCFIIVEISVFQNFFTCVSIVLGF